MGIQNNMFEIFDFEDENIENLILKSRDVLRHQVSELTETYESAKLDWNSTSRTEVAIQLSKIIHPYLMLEEICLGNKEEE